MGRPCGGFLRGLGASKLGVAERGTYERRLQGAVGSFSRTDERVSQAERAAFTEVMEMGSA